MHFSLPVFALCLIAPLAAEERATKGVDLTLVPERGTIAAGETVTVALKIHHQPHFHTYWQNPGVAGVPTTLDWQLPAGFTAGPVQWPAPEKTFMATHPVHGYERDVMLLVDITAPAQLPAGPVELKAKAAWMACADGCYPGKKSLSVTLGTGVAGVVDAASAAEFAKARAELPQPLQGWKAELVSAAGGAKIQLHLTPEASGPAKLEGLYFFSSDGQVSSDQPQQVTRNGDGSVDLTAVRSEYSPKGGKTLPGVLMTTTSFSAGGPAYASISPAYATGKDDSSADEKDTASTAPSAAPKECDCEKP
ncbi:MAG: putative ThiO:disulfide interchange protein [Akkermansiaceae bacterium]|nr:putative ThiO:disulfide interchange protein [Akkermansiaceae bacterium]